MQNQKMAQWVTTQTDKPDPSTIRFHMSGELPSEFDIAMLRVVASDLYRVWLNGQPVGISEDWQGVNWRVTGIAKPGMNTIEVEVRTRQQPPVYESSFLCELAVADKQGVKLAQILSDELTSSDQGTPKLAKSSFVEEWIDYLPAWIDDMLDEGHPPTRKLLSVNTTAQKELYELDQPIELAVAVHTFDQSTDIPVKLELEEWNGRIIRLPSVVCKPDARVMLPSVTEGLYRLTAKSGRLAATAAFAVVPVGQTTISSLLPKLRPYTRRKQMLGLNGNALVVRSPAALWSFREMDINLLVTHIMPIYTQNGLCDDLIAYCQATGTRFTINVEAPNFALTSDATDGKNSYEAADGCHRWDVDPETLRNAAATGVFEGVTYDESEHMQLSRNAYSQQPEPNRKPYFVETTGMSLPEAYDTFKKTLKRLVQRNRRYGASMQEEAVFPALWSPMAECGMTIVPKLLKEDAHPVVLAEALGAAIQHDAELWFTPDLWHYAALPGHNAPDMPGHSARHLQMALRCCHQAGVDNCYVEYATKLFSQSGSGYRLTQHGQVLKEHITGWIPAHARSYSYTDYQPEVAIVRFPDSDWGQSSCYYPDYLYGAMNLQSSPETREHMQVWSLLTDGVLDGRVVNFNGERDAHLRAYQPWRFTIPSPAVAVFDHNVGLKNLKGIGVIFACGIELSEATMAALQSCVKAGAVCFISQHLAPSRLQQPLDGSAVRIPEGKGSWVVMSRFTPEAMQPYRHLLPKNDGSMWLRFKGRRVKLG
ncbi:MAG: hypothetical protein ACYC1M_14060 [Armatimonadota bacterium]